MRRLLVLCLALAIAGCAAAAPEPTRFPVFFHEWSAAFDDGAKGAIAEAAKFAIAHPSASVTVTGFADMVGSPAANKDLSQLRARVVTDELVADGVAAARIVVKGAGSVGTAMNNVEARRVEIDVAAP